MRRQAPKGCAISPHLPSRYSIRETTGRRALELLLTGPESGAAAALIQAIWPLVPLDAFDRMALRLRDDGALMQRVGRMFAGDFWAETALPALQRWNADRAAGVERPATLAPERIGPERIGPERDHLAWDGFDGRLVSFAHACNAAIRFHTRPKAGVAIVATARSEGIYLLEWIAYHRRLGVEAFYLYTNNNDDGSDALLAALHAAGVITWIRSEMAPGTSAQNKAYGHALNLLLPLLEYRWAFLIDIDEFVVINPDHYATLGDFTANQEAWGADVVGMTWTMVGSSGQTRWRDEPLTRRNTHLRRDPNRHIKVMLSPRQFVQAHPHFPFADPRRPCVFRLASGELHRHLKQSPGAYHARAFADEATDDDASVYHYYYKSVEEFVWKSSRNRGDWPMSPATDFASLDAAALTQFLAQHHSMVFTENDRLARCAPALDEEIAALRRLPGVGAAESEVKAQFAARCATIQQQLLASGKLETLGADGERLRQLLLQLGA